MNTFSLHAAIMLAVLIAGCAVAPGQPDREEMYIRAAMLTKLSAAVESTVRYKNPPPDLSETELLAVATRHDPVLLENFKGYTVRVLRQERHSIVLVCDRTGARALLEDAGCSGSMDRARWMDASEPCEFSLDTAAVCKAN